MVQRQGGDRIGNAAHLCAPIAIDGDCWLPLVGGAATIGVRQCNARRDFGPRSMPEAATGRSGHTAYHRHGLI
jgi:hypothetical protein